MASCDVFCAKYTVFTVNVLTSLIGIILFIAGIVVFFVFGHHSQGFVVEQLWSNSVIWVFLGLGIFVISFVGVCGAIARSPCTISLFSTILTVLVTLQFGIGIYSTIRPDQAVDAWDRAFNQTFTNYKINNELWNFMQYELKCCGVNGPSDWVTGSQKGDFHPSCCPKLSANGNCTIIEASKLGCKQAVSTFLKSHSWSVAGIVFGVGLIQILLIGWSCFLYGAFRKAKSKSIP